MNLFLKLFKKALGASASAKKGKPKGGAASPAVSSFLEHNVREIRNRLGNSTDLMIRSFLLGEQNPRRIAAVYIEGLAETKQVLEPIMTIMHEHAGQGIRWAASDADDLLQRLTIPVGKVRMEPELAGAMKDLLSGDMVILMDGMPFAVIAGTRKWKERSIQEPNAEPVVRGPRDGFTESLSVNTALVRRRIRDPNLWLETVTVGRVSQTDVAFMYMNGIASKEVVKDVRDRLKSIDIDSVLESGYIEEFIQDKTITVFPMVYSSERPDVICSEILEGKVAILVDGTPFVLVVPAMFIQFMQAAEDHYQRWEFSSFIRIIRYASLMITLLAPAMYVAITTFHQEILPPELLMSLAAAREGVPFPAFVEALMMEVTFEILREAGVRMPKTIGQAVSIVGTLVIGQAAVEAGLVSPAMVIIVAVTAIANFVIPNYSMAISFRLLRFFMMLMAGMLGIFGILIGMFIVVFHLCSLRSFGIPYMTTFAPFHLEDQKDAFFRFPRWAMVTRPSFTRKRNYVRMDPGGKEDRP